MLKHSEKLVVDYNLLRDFLFLPEDRIKIGMYTVFFKSWDRFKYIGDNTFSLKLSGNPYVSGEYSLNGGVGGRLPDSMTFFYNKYSQTPFFPRRSRYASRYFRSVYGITHPFFRDNGYMPLLSGPVNPITSPKYLSHAYKVKDFLVYRFFYDRFLYPLFYMSRFGYLYRSHVSLADVDSDA